jgi:O-antigen biosynthesis protein
MNINSHRLKLIIKNFATKLAPFDSKRYLFYRKIVLLIKLLSPFNQKYQKWIKQFDIPNEEQVKKIRKDIQDNEGYPSFSIIMPIYDPPVNFLHEAFRSVLEQEYPYWELCVADDASTNPEIRSIIKYYANQDSRIKYNFRKENGHISAASNSALELATGDYIVLLDHDDKLHPFALYSTARAINEHPDCVIVYSDEDKITATGKRLEPYFKPDFDYDLLLNHNYLIHLGAYKLSSVREIGGFRLGFEGSQDYDLILRLIDETKFENIIHIPQILYHWRMLTKSTAQNVNIKPYAAVSAVHAIEDHFQRKGIKGSVKYIPEFAKFQPYYQISQPKPNVEILYILKKEDINQCIKTFHKNIKYQNFHLIVFYNNLSRNTDSSVNQERMKNSKISYHQYKDSDDITRIINHHVVNSKADFICLITNCVKGFTDGWLSTMMEQAIQNGVGVVSPKLVDSNEKIYSNGIILSQEGTAKHLFQKKHLSDPGYLYWAMIQRGYSALSGECLLFSKKIFEEVNGINPSIKSKLYRYVDFCLKIRSQNLTNILVPSIILHINEKEINENTRQSIEELTSEKTILFNRWEHWFSHDPAFNKNLLIENGSITINLSSQNNYLTQ